MAGKSLWYMQNIRLNPRDTNVRTWLGMLVWAIGGDLLQRLWVAPALLQLALGSSQALGRFNTKVITEDELNLLE